MRKVIIAVAIVGLAAVGGYQWFKSDSGLDAKLTTALSAVPSDTALLSAYLEPIDMVAYMQHMGGLSPAMLEQMQADISVMLEGLSEADISAEGTENANLLKFMIAYAKTLIEVLQGDVSLEEQMGYAQETRILSYMVGAAPVIRWETANPARVIDFIENLESEYGVTPELLTVAGETVRSYSFDYDTEQKWSIWFHTNAEWTTLSLYSSAFPTAEHGLLIGAEAAPNNVVADGSFETIRARYDLEHESVGWILSEVLTDAVTNRKANRLGRDLRAIFPDAFMQPEMTQWSSTACQTDLHTISERFPGLFSDLHVARDETDTMSVQARLVIPIMHESTIAALQKIRGIVPTFLKRSLDDVIAALAIGVDASQVGPVASELWNATAQANFSCEPLVNLQETMRQQPIGGALAMSNMANGLLGLQVLVNDVDVEGLAQGDFSGQKMAVSASLSDVTAFYSVLQASFPPLAGVNLPKVGESVDISPVMAMGLGIPLNANMSRGENQLTIATLDNVSQTYKERLNQTAEDEHGLLAMSIDNGKIAELIEAQFTAQGQPIPDELQSLLGQNHVASVTMDVSLRGIEFVYTAETPNE